MLKKMMLMLLTMAVFFSVTAFAVDMVGGYPVPVDIAVNGDFIKCFKKPIMIDSTTYIPLRAFSDAIRGDISWDDATKAATMTKDGHSFVFYTQTDNCVIDGEETGYTSVLYQNLTFIPVRAVSEVLEYDVEWDDFYLTVKITAPNVEVPDECKDFSYTYDDILYLSKVTQIESGYQHFTVRLGVAGTVVNRVASSQFPNSIKEVIFDTRYGVQFPPAHTDKINVTPSKETVIAAKCALNGGNVVGKALYFIDTKYAASSWAHNNRPHAVTLHDMSFYE